MMDLPTTEPNPVKTEEQQDEDNEGEQEEEAIVEGDNVKIEQEVEEEDMNDTEEGQKSAGEDDDGDDDNEENEDDDGTAEDTPAPLAKTTSSPRRGRRRGVKRKRARSTFGKRVKGTMRCEHCEMEMSVSNIQRHYKTCHNAAHEFVCRYCSCRFEVAYGRMVHEVRNHQANLTAAGYVPYADRARTGLNVKKKVVHIKPAVTNKIKVTESSTLSSSSRSSRRPPPGSFAETINNTFSMSEEQKAACNAHIRQLGNDSKGRYECTVCNKTFLGSRNARDHMNSHLNAKPYKCPLCNFCFSFRSNVARHIKSCHTENSAFVCPYGCGCSMQSESSLKIHMNLVCNLRKNKQVLKPVVVPIASRATTRPPAVVVKLESSTPPSLVEKPQTLSSTAAADKIHKCPRCYMTFSFKSNIRRHLISAHVPNGRFKCPMKCGCTMNNQHALQSHLNKCKTEILKRRRGQQQQQQALLSAKMRQQGTNSLVLNQSSSRTASPPKVSTLLPKPPLPTLMPRPPPLTPAPFLSAQYSANASNNFKNSMMATSSLGKPMLNVSQQKVFKGGPSSTTATHSLLNLNDPIPKSCPICQQSIHGRHHYNKHMTGCHVRGGSFICDFCPCTFDSQGNLSRHHTLMHPNILHRSATAESTATYEEELEEELLQEEEHYDDDDDQRQPWSQVETSYSTNSPQGEYQDNEEEENGAYEITPTGKRFICKDCGKTFDKMSRYKLHITVHTTEKPYKCKQCDQSFRLPGILATHTKRSHGSGQFLCELCPSRFTSAKGLSVHEYMYHKGGRKEREVGRGYQTAQMPVLRKPSPVPNSIPPLKKVNSIQGSNNSSYTSSSTSRPQFVHQKQRQVLPKLTNKPIVSTTASVTEPRHVKLKCHICAQIFFGTGSLGEHMKEHSIQNQQQRRPQQQQQQQFSRAATTTRNFQSVSRVNNNNSSNYRLLNNGQSQQRQYSLPASGRGNYSEATEYYYDQDQEGTYGYENGYENGDDLDDMEMVEQGASGMGYQYYDDGGDEEEYDDGEDNYGYINAGDHLEIVHSENNVSYDNDDDGNMEAGFNVEVEMGEEGEDEEDNNFQQDDDNNDVDAMNEDQQQTTDIYCKGCKQWFTDSEEFTFHVENNPTIGTQRCSFCCEKGLTEETLSGHIARMHPTEN